MKLLLLPLFWGLWYLAFSSRSIISPYLPLIAEEFSINHALAGGLYLFSAAGTTLALSLAGPAAMRIGYKRVIAISFCLGVVALVAVYSAKTYATFAAALFFFGLGGGAYLPCAIPILTSAFEQRHWGKVIAFHETAAGFSILSIPVIAAYALGFMPWRTLFLVLSGLFLMITIFFWLASPDPRPKPTASSGLKALFKRVDFWIMTVFWVVNGIITMGVYGIVPLFLVNEKGLSVETANQILGFTRTGGFIGMISVGFILDRYNTKKIMLFLTLVAGVSTLGLGVVPGGWPLVAMLFIQGTFCVIFFPVGLVAISKMTDPSERGGYTGTLMAFAVVLGYGLSPLFLGVIADIWNFQVGLFIIGLLAVAVCPLLKFLKVN